MACVLDEGGKCIMLKLNTQHNTNHSQATGPVDGFSMTVGVMAYPVETRDLQQIILHATHKQTCDMQNDQTSEAEPILLATCICESSGGRGERV
mmetsp:Transcript_53044/g.94665  ORF Transcript_53044/g.94665 Transcript_53044/m.94665 type:complete len:94 (-) Transcript_53044:329-610(-)